MKTYFLCKSLAVAVLALMAATSSVSASSKAPEEKIVKIDGSSTVAPVSTAVAEDFKNASKANKNINVTICVSGTGGGFKKFCRGETDISNASRPISAKEMADAKTNSIEYIELPVCFDALTVVIHKDNTWAKTMTVEQLKKLWEPAAQGTITRWNQIDPSWPDQPIKLYGPGTDSGTFDYFTEAVCGKAKASRGDYTASEDDNVLVTGVEGDKYALGYFGFAYYIAHKDKLQAVKIDWEKDQLSAQEPSVENVLKGIYNPLSRPLFIYVNKKSVQTKPEVRKFVDFYLTKVKTLAADVKYIPLPDSAYELCKSRFAKLETGTAFGGEAEVGLHIDEVLKKPLKN